MKKLVLFVLVVFAISCGDNKPKGKVHFFNKYSIDGLGKKVIDIDTIYAENDSLAYCMAFKKYEMSYAINDYYKRNKGKYFSIYEGFKLFNEDNENITNTSVKKTDSINSILIEELKESETYVKMIDYDPSKPQEIEYTEEDIEKQFSKWDGSHIKLEEYLVSKLKNPDSYEHVKSEYAERKTYLEVKLTYRGTNSYNAIVTSSISAKCDLKTGQVLEIIE